MKRRIAMFTAALVLMSVSAFAEEYKFKVTNNTDTKIVKIFVAPDDEHYKFFDIGKGIPSGETVTLVWDQSTNGEACEQYFKAIFENGEDSVSQKFDFCEEDVEIHFE